MAKNSKEKQQEYDAKRAGQRTRNWTLIFYPEDLPENWKELVDGLLVRWIEGPLHDKDVLPDGAPKKSHHHTLFMFENVKTVEQVSELFKELFGGGHAELRLDNEDNPLESGIEIIAQPPGKKLQNINLMSGGEKTMTAIALMFAVLKAKPTPFCILDEVEAALDEANIDRFAKYLQNFREIQFALVTHQKATMEYADVLYGVTMPEQGISKVLSLRMGDNFE